MKMDKTLCLVFFVFTTVALVLVDYYEIISRGGYIYNRSIYIHVWKLKYFDNFSTNSSFDFVLGEHVIGKLQRLLSTML